MNARLLQIISRLFQMPADRIDAETGPHSVAAWDSAGHLNLMLELEKEFGVKLDDDEVVELVSVGAIEEALRRHGVAASAMQDR
jgi:acyl carrier protein